MKSRTTSERNKEYTQMIADSIIRNTMARDGSEVDGVVSSRHILPPSAYPEVRGRELVFQYTARVRELLPAHLAPEYARPANTTPNYLPYKRRYTIEEPPAPIELDMSVLRPQITYDDQHLCKFVRTYNPSTGQGEVIKTLLCPDFANYNAYAGYKTVASRAVAEVTLLGMGRMTVSARDIHITNLQRYLFELVFTRRDVRDTEAIFPGVRCIPYETDEGDVQLPMEFALFPDHERFALQLCVARLKEEKIQHVRFAFSERCKEYAVFDHSQVQLPGAVWAMEHLSVLRAQTNPANRLLHEAKVHALLSMCREMDFTEKAYLPEVKIWAKCLEAKYILDHMLHLHDKNLQRLEITSYNGLNIYGREIGIPVFAGMTVLESAHEYWRQEREWMACFPYVETLVEELEKLARTPEVERRLLKRRAKDTRSIFWNYDPVTGEEIRRIPRGGI